MATEAQRLLMMSLGKIQGCRQQRGGINLYKSLLVTKVLYRARSIAMNEHTSPSKEQEEQEQQVQQPEDENEDQRVPEMVMHSEPDTHVVTEDTELHDQSRVDYNNEDTEDKENAKPVDSINIKPHNEPLSGPEDFSKSVYQEKAARRVKRRLTEVEQAVDSISPKKQKLEETQPAHEPMQVDLSGLVNRFSNSFTGLLNNDSDNYSNEDTTSEEEGQGHSDSGLHSCSTQIKESFDLLARPIALSVWTIHWLMF